MRRQMSNRRCPRVRPSRLAREKEWLAYNIFMFTGFVRIGLSEKPVSLTRTQRAYQMPKDESHAPSDR